MANNSYLPTAYQPGWSYGNSQQYQSYAQPIQQQYAAPQSVSQGNGIRWVDGEAEAKGTPIPPGTSQFAMWDINEPVIYIKTLNQMGMPNPMQKARYKLEQSGQNNSMNSGFSGQQEQNADYVKKSDLEDMKKELKEMIQNQQSGRRGQRNDADA